MRFGYYAMATAALTVAFWAANIHSTPLVLAEQVPLTPTPTCVASTQGCDSQNGGGGGGHIGEGSIGRASGSRWDSQETSTPTPTPPPCDQNDPDCTWPNGGGGGGHIGEG